MKITDLAIIAVAAFLPFSLSLDISMRNQLKSQSYTQVFTNAMSVASEDATAVLAENIEDVEEGEYDEDDEIPNGEDISFPTLNKEEAIDRFYQSVYACLGITQDKVSQMSLESFLPIQMIIDYDGIYVHSKGEWSMKYPFTYYDKNSKLVFAITLTDYIHIYDLSTGTYLEGIAQDFGEVYPTCKFLNNIQYFKNAKREIIVNTVSSLLESYIVQNSLYSSKEKDSYTFFIPYIDKESWGNTITDIGFICFMKSPLTNSISSMGYAGCKISQADPVYGSGGLYHKKSCPDILDDYTIYSSRKDAAIAGLNHCNKCNS